MTKQFYEFLKDLPIWKGQFEPFGDKNNKIFIFLFKKMVELNRKVYQRNLITDGNLLSEWRQWGALGHDIWPNYPLHVNSRIIDEIIKKWTIGKIIATNFSLTKTCENVLVLPRDSQNKIGFYVKKIVLIKLL